MQRIVEAGSGSGDLDESFEVDALDDTNVTDNRSHRNLDHVGSDGVTAVGDHIRNETHNRYDRSSGFQRSDRVVQ